VTEQTREWIRLFEEGFEKHYALDWEVAPACFEQIKEIESNIPGVTPGVVTNPSQVYLKIVANY
tara:strand:- start:414 stop:605 length:192 start_codon:yes stop_codon:yes gene_type:complete